MNPVANDIYYVGVNDHDIDLFEGMFDVRENGMAYNSYVIRDEKIAVMDTVDASAGDEWLAALENALDGCTPDYLVIQHMEPDHSACIGRFLSIYPSTTVVSSKPAFIMLENYFGKDCAPNRLVVADGDTLSLGKHELQFIGAAWIHWPEVVMSYDAYAKVFFSADAFGKFGALDVDEEWACEARRYYFGIVGQFGKQVQGLLAKAAELDIQTICPLHGPVLSEDLGYYLGLYNTWSSYGVETEGIVVAYTSIYGHTKQVAELLAAKLEEAGCERVVLIDIAREDMHESIEDAFRHGTLVCCTTTYYNKVFPAMQQFIDHLVERKFQKRRVAFVQNGSWGPAAAKGMRTAFEACADIEFVEPVVTVKGSMTEETKAALDELVAALLQS